MTLWLNEDELVQLTGYVTKARQRKALTDMNIPFRSRPLDGYPLVQRSIFESLGADRKRREPRWDALQ